MIKRSSIPGKTGINQRLWLRIDLPVWLAFALFAGLIFLYLIPGFKTVMMEKKRDLIHEISATAFSVVQYHHSLETTGQLTTEAAQAQALQAISSIRYGTELKDYFWITDLQPKMLMHPYRQELTGSDLSDFKDSRGKLIFVDFVNAVSASGENYVTYMWQWNDDSTRIVPKLSYVRLFKPWNWVIGTGIYVEDVRSEIRAIIIRAVIISGAIGLVIILLLMLVSRHSHRIEARRQAAEDEVRKSRELYRTLAEAATEGVLIWSASGLQANKTLLSWLGQEEEQIRYLNLGDLLHAETLPAFSEAEELYRALDKRIHATAQIKGPGGYPLQVHTDLSRIDLNGQPAVLAVMRQVSSLTSVASLSLHPALLQHVQTGFFRISYGKKNRFLYASDPVLHLLGYARIQDILTLSLDAFFDNPLQYRTLRASLAAGEDYFNQEVCIRKRNGDRCWVLLNIKIIREGNTEPWCEGSMEPMTAAGLLPGTLSPDLTPYAASLVLQAPAAQCMRPLASCRETDSVGTALQRMKESGNQVMVVMLQGKEPMGVIDTNSLSFRLAQGESAETPCYRWMHSPPIFMRATTPLAEAVSLLHQNNAPCLVLTSETDEAVGMLTGQDLLYALSALPSGLQAAITEAGSAKALREIYLQGRQTAMFMVWAKADPGAVTRFVSALGDAICKRVIQLCLAETSPPPCSWAFIQTGSAGRLEQTFSTDQDNAIIFEDVPDEHRSQTQAYFLALGRHVNEMLAQTGFRLCPGNNMAGNPTWCQPLQQWKDYFHKWISGPGPEELLETSIFFDFRFTMGDETLVLKLKEYVLHGLHASDIFFHHMTLAFKPFQAVAGGTESTSTDLKRLLLPLTGLVRMYALKHGLTENHTVDRMMGLYQGKHLHADLLQACLMAWKNLSMLRLWQQSRQIHDGKEPGNILEYQADNIDAQYFIRAGADAVTRLLQQAAMDFHTHSG